MADNAKPVVIFFGDSLTAWSFTTKHGQGFGEVFTAHFAKSGIEVENEGYPGYTSETVQKNFASIMHRIRTVYPVPPLLITIFFGANDAVLMSGVHVPLPKFADNIRSFVDQILFTKKASSTRILLITPPPVNVHKAEWPTTITDEPEDITEEEFEQQCRDTRGFKTWQNKLTYAQKILEIAGEYERAAAERGVDCRVAAVDFWRDVTNFALDKEGRDPLPEAIEVESKARIPGSGLPGAEEFSEKVFTDRLHLGEDGYRVLTKSITDVLQAKWPDILAG